MMKRAMKADSQITCPAYTGGGTLQASFIEFYM